MNASAEQRYFTIEEANQRLPLISKIVNDIVLLYADIHQRRERLVSVRQKSMSHDSSHNNMYGDELVEIERDIETDIQHYQGYVEELRALDVELKDPEKGLVDFRSLFDGREVYLCWQLGESEIGFWHELDGGFAGRLSIFEGSAPGQVDEKSPLDNNE